EFLEYIVQHTISGPGGALKERSIGVEVFRLPKDFDTGQHTVVRVTANEVRKKLAQQYLAENGAYRPIKIDLPPGSYSAAFTWGAPAAEPPIPAPLDIEPQVQVQPDPPSRPNWLSHPAFVCATTLMVVAGGFYLWRSRAAAPISVVAKSPAVSGYAPALLPAGGDLRMFVGSTSPYLDRSGRSWGL